MRGGNEERGGYGVLPGILSVRQAEILAAGLTGANLPRSRAGIRHLMGHPEVSRVAHSMELAGLASAVLGDSAIPFRATLFDKSPASNWLVMWRRTLRSH